MTDEVVKLQFAAYCFKNAMKDRFATRSDLEILQDLHTLRQRGPVDGYMTKFERLYTQIPSLDTRSATAIFVTGLRQDIGQEVRRRAPKSLTEAYRLAIEMERATDSSDDDVATNRHRRQWQPYPNPRFSQPRNHSHFHDKGNHRSEEHRDQRPPGQPAFSSNPLPPRARTQPSNSSDQ